ncbi:MAG: hypothetical protein EOP62_14330 [Sphingomonadales bacterium]|nr:MAG: hypothetical protein EOP62_14330 [Sphingomonadales bacterium]
MLINSGNLRSLGTGFKANFSTGLAMATPDHLQIATEVTSTTGKEEYGWLGQVPGMREWLGDRVIQNIMTHDYAIKNKDWELTIGVKRNDIQDDNIGIYAPLFQEMGRAVTAHPSQLCYPALKAGFSTICYDGQYFFDTDHPVLDENGVLQSVANTDGGSGAPWFIIDDTRAIKPIIFQKRKVADFVAMDNPDDESVWRRKEFEYGVDTRDNVGYAFWQFAWGSKQPLTPANFEIGLAALQNMKGDYGRPLGLGANPLLVVSPTLRSAGTKIVKSDVDASGASNANKDAARLFVTPWLA